MREIYLMYSQERTTGDVNISASKDSINPIHDDPNPLLRHVFTTQETPIAVLTRLEQLAREHQVDTTWRSFLPGVDDGLDGDLQYMPEASWPKKRESQQNADARAIESTRTRNETLVGVYNAFVESNSARRL